MIKVQFCSSDILRKRILTKLVHTFLRNNFFFLSVEEIADLNDQLVGLQQSKDVEKERQDNEMHLRRNEFKETKDQLLTKNTSFGNSKSYNKLIMSQSKIYIISLSKRYKISLKMN